MQLIYTSAAAAKRRVRFVLVSSSDGITLQTGVTISSGDLKVSKNGGAYANATGTWTEISDGEYYYEFASGEIDTTGELVVRYSKTGTKTVRRVCQVVAFDPMDATRLGLAALPNAAAEAAGGLFTRGTGAGQINQDANGRIDANVKAVDGATTQATNLKNYLDSSVGFVNAKNVVSANIIALGDYSGTPTPSSFVDTARSFFDVGTGVDLPLVNIGGIAGTLVRLPVEAATSNTLTLSIAISGSILADSVLAKKGFIITNCDNPEAICQSGVIESYDYVTRVATIKCNESGGGNFLHVPTGTIQVAINFGITAILAATAHPVATITTIDTDLSTIEGKIDTVDSNVDTVITDTNTLKSDTTVLKSDTTTLKSDTTTLKSDTTTLKSDTTTLKADTAILKSDTSTLKSDTTTLKSDTTTLKGDTSTLKTDVDALQVDTANIITAIDNIDTGGGGGGDPLSNPVPGSYAAGTAGYALAAIKAKTDTLGSLIVQHINPVLTNLDVVIIQGDDYKAADGRSLDFTSRTDTWPSLVGASNIKLKINGYPTVTGSLVGTTTLRFEMTATETAAIPEGQYLYEVSFVNANSNTITLIQATLYVRKQLT